MVTDELTPESQSDPTETSEIADPKDLLSLRPSQSESVPPASDITLGVLLLIGAVLIVRYLREIPSEAEMILRISASGFVISGIGVILSGIRGLRAADAAGATDISAGSVPPSRLRQLLDRRLLVVPIGELLVVLAIWMFILIMPRFGFVIASAALVIVTLVVYRERRWYWVAPVAALSIYALDWLFFGFLNLRTF
jgi:hypothetical protein